MTGRKAKKWQPGDPIPEFTAFTEEGWEAIRLWLPSGAPADARAIPRGIRAAPVGPPGWPETGICGRSESARYVAPGRRSYRAPDRLARARGGSHALGERHNGRGHTGPVNPIQDLASRYFGAIRGLPASWPRIAHFAREGLRACASSISTISTIAGGNAVTSVVWLLYQDRQSGRVQIR
jgi:hypothetical protein